MATREEIRGVIDTYTDDGCLFPDRSCNALGSGYCSSNDEAYKCLMERLTNIGVVIKVDRELPLEDIIQALETDITDRRGLKSEWYNIDEEVMAEVKATWMEIIKKQLAGYEAVEPLIKEDNYARSI